MVLFGYTLHVHGRKEYTQHIYTADDGKGCTLHPVLGVETDTPPRQYFCWWTGIHRKGIQYTLTSTLLTMERDTTLMSHCWWWNGIHPHVYTVEYGKRYTSSSYCW
jgi:hypothetical protein